MDILSKAPYFFGAAAGGFIVMACVGVQALVALFSSIPLAKRRRRENPAFDLGKAYRRIVMVIIMVALLVGVISAVVIHFTSTAATVGYLFGMIVAFLCCLQRMTPNNEQNQKNFDEAYADCYPFVPKAPQAPAETAAEQIEAPAEQPGPEEAQPENGGGEL